MPRTFDSGLTMAGAPALNAFAVTPSDTVDLARVARAIYLGGGGDVKLTTVNGDTVTFSAMVSGLVHPISSTRIWAGGTTATLIVALY